MLELGFKQLYPTGVLSFWELMEQMCGAVMGERCSSISPGGGHVHSAPVTKVEIVIIDKGIT